MPCDPNLVKSWPPILRPSFHHSTSIGKSPSVTVQITRNLFPRVKFLGKANLSTKGDTVQQNKNKHVKVVVVQCKETITVRSSPCARPGGWICLAKGIPRLREFSTYYAAPLKEIFKQRPLFWFWLWCGIFIWKITQSGYSIWGLCYESASPAVNSQDWTLL